MPVVAQQFIPLEFTEDNSVRRIAISEIQDKGYTTPEAIAVKTGQDIETVKEKLQVMATEKKIVCDDNYQLCCKDLRLVTEFSRKLKSLRTT